MTTAGPVTAAFSIGANLGDRADALQFAVCRLRELVPHETALVSGVYETDPFGGPEQPDFLNLVLVLRGVLPPDPAPSWDEQSGAGLLAVCHRIEAERNRVRSIRWGPRTLDVDLLVVGDRVVQTAELTLPHPRLQDRAFVLVPWAQVDQEFEVVGQGRVGELLARLPQTELRSVRPWSPTGG